MQDMQLFIVPIYAMSKKNFDKRFESHVNHLSSNDEENKQILMKSNFISRIKIWEFNQIIGYVKVIATNSIFRFELWLDEKRRNRIDSVKKPEIRLLDTRYLNYNCCSSNAEWQSQMVSKINAVVSHTFPRFYIDIDALQNILPYIKFDELIIKMKSKSCP